MGASKTDHFSAEHNRMANLAKAMGHPARIAIIEYLLQTEGCIGGDIVNVLPLSQPTVSQHLRELKNAGIIQGSIDGNAICYCVNETTIATLKHFIDQISKKIIEKKSCC